MTVVLRRRASVFHAEGGWFSANWHFSFDQYWDEANMGLGDLGVSNGARLVPGAAWPMHPHRDIEGIAYVAEGTFEHADSRGNGGVLRPGSVQRATLGSGMQHSERNGSTTEPMRFIQMWIMPSRRGLEPSIEQREFSAESRRKDRKSTRLNSSHGYISYAVFCLKKKLPAGNSVSKIPIVIVGGRIAGLSAAWRLDKPRFPDFGLLEMEPQPGGNDPLCENAITH